MNIHKLILFLFFHVSSFIHITTSISCPTPSFCGDLNVPIKYPFQLINNPPENFNNYCTYPSGFTIACNPQSKLILNLPHYGDFHVNNISYTDRTIHLGDPNNCLPKRLLAKSLSLLSSPFVDTYSVNYSMFSCPKNITKYGYSAISCMSNSTMSMVMGYNYSVLMTTKCNFVGTLFGVPFVSHSEYYGVVLDEIVLTWPYYYYSTCDDAALCSYSNSYINTSTKAAEKGSQSHTSIGLIIFIPFAVVGLITFSIIWCKHSSTRSSSGAGITTAREDLMTPQPTVVIGGVDDSIIEMRSVKVILGESFRELVSSDYYSKICSICLSDFSPNETIRCIVECQHYYHSDCIDEWLRIKGMCPVCRNVVAL